MVGRPRVPTWILLIDLKVRRRHDWRPHVLGHTHNGDNIVCCDYIINIQTALTHAYTPIRHFDGNQLTYATPTLFTSAGLTNIQQMLVVTMIPCCYFQHILCDYLNSYLPPSLC